MPSRTSRIWLGGESERGAYGVTLDRRVTTETASAATGSIVEYGCATEVAMDLLRGKWAVVILARVKEAPQRYADLRDALPISDKMLTTRLRDLEERDLLERDERRRYVLTTRAESLRSVLQAIYDWGLLEAERRGLSIATHRSVR
ncbi:MAG: helix-turn-helix domain-containing protein [Myxococcota bacterium]